MHIVTCSNCLDSKRIVALITGVNKNKIFFCKFSHKFSCKLSILLVQNISLLDKPRKLVSCVRADHENETQMLLNPSIQIFIDAQGVIVYRDERYALRSAEVSVSFSSSCLHSPRPTLLEFLKHQNSYPQGNKSCVKNP